MAGFDDALGVIGLSAGYGGRTIVHPLDLAPVAPGQVVSLIGPNAAGTAACR